MTNESQLQPHSRTVVRYMIACAVTGLVAVAGAWAFVGPAGRVGIAVAAFLAWIVQVGTFPVLLSRGGEMAAPFFKAMAIGILARVLTLTIAAIVAVRFVPEGAAVLLLGLVILLSIMLVLESRYFRATHVGS